MDSPRTDLEFHAPGPEELQPHFPAYEIGGFIAQGGMGAVYAARQLSLDRPVAIKILPRQFGDDPQFRAGFEAEAKAMARLNHPNLIGVYDFGDADGMLYIIMELVHGKSLHHSAHGKAIEQQEAARIVSGICRGLAHAHQAGILHRDIKPGNILLGAGAIPKIGDFGLARPLEAGHNPEEIVWGTPGYSAPELLSDPEKVDHRADIFSVGVLLHELLTARLPADPWEPPSTISGCRPEFDAIVRRSIDPSPEQRYPDAEELADELDALNAKLSGGRLRRAATLPGAVPKPSPVFGGRPSAPPLASAKSKTTPALVVVALVIGIAIVAGLIIASAGKRRTPVAPQATPDREAAPVASPPQENATPDEQPRRNDDPLVRNDRPEPPPEDPPTPAPEPEDPPAESPRDILARLQPQMRKGNLAEFPPGTVAHNGAHFFLVSTPLPWHAALAFAEDHGAQLAVLETTEGLAWAASQFDPGTAVWLGLSDSGTESKWFWVNGHAIDKNLWAPGQPDDTPSQQDGEDFAALLPGGKLDDLAGARELPFLLQWNRGGSNEGSLARQIERVGEALEAGRAPVFPAGSRNIDGSRFLLVPQSLSWEEASAFATSAGGHLAVPSSPAEAAWIARTLQKKLNADDGCWIGGRRATSSGLPWRFVTGEKLEFVAWAPGQPADSEEPRPVLLIGRGSDGEVGLRNATERADEASCFLLEWSAPSRRNMPGKDELRRPANVAEWLRAERQATAEREEVAFNRYQRRHDKNVQDFVADIQSEVNTARRQEFRVLERLAEEFGKQITAEGRIPEEISPVAQRFVGDLHKKALEKQTDLWADYLPDFSRAQERYLAAVKAEAERRLRHGDRQAAAYLAREQQAAAEDPYFKQILAGQFPPLPDPAEEEEDDR